MTAAVRRPGRPPRREATRREVTGLYDAIRSEAACLGDWELFAPAGSANLRGGRVRTKAAQEICATCPVIAECARLAEIIRPCFGVWAGRVYEPKPTKASKG